MSAYTAFYGQALFEDYMSRFTQAFPCPGVFFQGCSKQLHAHRVHAFHFRQSSVSRQYAKSFKECPVPFSVKAAYHIWSFAVIRHGNIDILEIPKKVDH